MAEKKALLNANKENSTDGLSANQSLPILPVLPLPDRPSLQPSSYSIVSSPTPSFDELIEIDFDDEDYFVKSMFRRDLKEIKSVKVLYLNMFF